MDWEKRIRPWTPEKGFQAFIPQDGIRNHRGGKKAGLSGWQQAEEGASGHSSGPMPFAL
jgi:hypothetical protein